MKALFRIGLALMLVLTFVCTSVSAVKSNNTAETPCVSVNAETVGSIAVTLEAPVLNKALPTTAVCDSTCKIESVTWSPNDTKAASETAYTATIRIVGADGNSILVGCKTTVNGTTVSGVFSNGAVVLTYTFPKTEKAIRAEDAVITKQPESIAVWQNYQNSNMQVCFDTSLKGLNYTYQWYQSEDGEGTIQGSKTWTALSGQTTDTLHYPTDELGVFYYRGLIKIDDVYGNVVYKETDTICVGIIERPEEKTEEVTESVKEPVTEPEPVVTEAPAETEEAVIVVVDDPADTEKAETEADTEPVLPVIETEAESETETEPAAVETEGSVTETAEATAPDTDDTEADNTFAGKVRTLLRSAEENPVFFYGIFFLIFLFIILIIAIIIILLRRKNDPDDDDDDDDENADGN